MNFHSCHIRNSNNEVALTVKHELYSSRNKIYLRSEISSAKICDCGVSLGLIADILCPLNISEMELPDLTIECQESTQTSNRLAYSADFFVNENTPNQLASLQLVIALDKAIMDGYTKATKIKKSKSAQQ